MDILGKRKNEDSLETLQKLWVSTKFPDQEIRWSYGILFTKSLYDKHVSKIGAFLSKPEN